MEFDSEPPLDFDELDQMVQRLGYTEPSPHFHGAVCGALSRVPPESLDLVGLLTENAELSSPIEEADRESLAAFRQQCLLSLHSDELSFTPLLPDDGAPLRSRVESLAAWCSGFLFGLSSRVPLDRASLSQDAGEALNDLSEFTRAGYDPRANIELEETAYTELLEYVRVAAQLLFYELCPRNSPPDTEPLTLH